LQNSGGKKVSTPAGRAKKYRLHVKAYWM